MAKATKSVHPMSESLNRRRVLTGAVTAAASVAGAAVTHHAIAAPHAVAPTADGRRLLQLIATQKAVYAAAYDEQRGGPDEAGNAAMDVAYYDVQELGRAIAARPIASVADVVDRAILATWSCSPELDGQLISDGDDTGNFKAGHILAMLSLAGISPAQCNVGL